MKLEDLLPPHPEEPGEPPVGAENLPPYRMPTLEDVKAISLKYSCSFPPSFVKFQTELGKYLMWPDGFGWASPEVPPYMSLEAVIESASNWGCQPGRGLTPFFEEEGNFYCFDTAYADDQGEFRVVFWDHDEGAILEGDHLIWRNFACWLAEICDDEEEDQHEVQEVPSPCPKGQIVKTVTREIVPLEEVSCYIYPPSMVFELPTWRFLLHFAAPKNVNDDMLENAKSELRATDFGIVDFPFGIDSISIDEYGEAKVRMATVPIEITDDRKAKADSIELHDADVRMVIGIMAASGFQEKIYYEALDWEL